MSLKKNFEEIKGFDDGIREYLLASKENTLTEETIQRILHYIHISNYLQLFYNYGIELLIELTRYFQSVENYGQCILIRDTIDLHNKATGDNIKLIL